MAGRGRENADSALVAALAGGATVRDAAGRAGGGERTVHRRLEDPDFARQVAKVRAELVARTVALLTDAGAEAATTLRALLGAESETVRLGACRAILELGTKLREAEEQEARLDALEQQAAAEAAPDDRRGLRRWPA